MNRDHKVFRFEISYDAMVRNEDGTGELVSTRIERAIRVVTVIAPDVVYAKGWLIENPHRFPNVKIHNMVEQKIDAVVELHTY